MSRRIFLPAFYTHFHEFLDQLEIVFSGDSDVATYKTALALLQKTNPLLVPREVINHMTPFEDVIRKRDEKFFLDYEFSEYQDGTLDKVIGKVKVLWTTLTDGNKKAIWDYIIILLDLAKRCSDE